MKHIATILVVLVLLVLAAPVSAAIFHSGEEFTISQNEVVKEDIYAVGGSIATSGIVEGDVFAAAGKVLINGSVLQDVIAVGGNVDVLSDVSDDVRVAGGQVVIGGSVASDLIAFGGQVQVLKDISIGGDVILGGGRVVMEGNVSGDARVYGDQVHIDGVIEGDLEVFADNTFTLGEDARIGGSLTYRAPEELILGDGVVGGTVQFDEHRVRLDQSLLNAVMGAAFMLKLLMLLVAGLLFVVFFAPFAHTLNNFAVPHFGKSAVIGFVFLIVVPVLAVLLLFSIIGGVVAGIFTLLYLLALVSAKVYAGILTGALIARFAKKEIITDWRFATIGIVILQFVSLVPVIGWVLSFIITLGALGALVYMSYQKLWLER